MKRSGVDYEIFDETNDSNWPRGTFHVDTKRPYRLLQTYAASPKEFYIFTAGGSLEAGEHGLSKDQISDYAWARRVARDSLAKHLLTIHKRSPAEFLFHFQKGTSDDFFLPLKMFLRTKDTLVERRHIQLISAYKTGDNERFMKLKSAVFPSDEFPEESAPVQKTIGVLSCVLLILALWPGHSTRVRRLRLFGLSLFLFSFFSGLAELLVVYIPARFGNAIWNDWGFPAVFPVLFIPWISWHAARLFRSAHAKRVLISTAGLATIWATVMLWGARLDNTDPPGILAFENTLILLFVGLTFGIAFALAFGPLPKGKSDKHIASSGFFRLCSKG